jgi:hypothetical protein
VISSDEEQEGGKIEYLYEMFPDRTRRSLNMVVSLCRGKIDNACRMILDAGLTTKNILNLFRSNKCLTTVRHLDIDPEHLLEEALVLYKNPSFDPRVPFEITYRGTETCVNLA